jgi:hypothetical protein
MEDGGSGSFMQERRAVRALFWYIIDSTTDISDALHLDYAVTHTVSC